MSKIISIALIITCLSANAADKMRYFRIVYHGSKDGGVAYGEMAYVSTESYPIRDTITYYTQQKGVRNAIVISIDEQSKVQYNTYWGADTVLSNN